MNKIISNGVDFGQKIEIGDVIEYVDLGQESSWSIQTHRKHYRLRELVLGKGSPFLPLSNLALQGGTAHMAGGNGSFCKNLADH